MRKFLYIKFLPGDRASGIGGAYTAVSDDPSGSFYNPASFCHKLQDKVFLRNPERFKKFMKDNL